MKKILHFMNNFYLPFRHSIQYNKNVQENKTYEHHIQIIWNEFCQNQTFISQQKQQIKIISSGQWNTQAGADFQNAKISIDNKIYQGAVEIHLTPEQWYSHGHHWNSLYNNVILHIVWENPKQLIIPPHIPIIELKAQMHQHLAYAQTHSNYPYGKKIPYDTLAHQLKSLNDDKLKLIFQSAGLSRILVKSHSLTKQIISDGIEQTFYQNFMEIMGYKNNRLQFLQLAQTATISKLQGLDNHNQRQALLWGYSGLLPQSLPSYEIHQDLMLFTNKLWQTWWTLRTEDNIHIKWSRQAQRPVNTPERRLAGIINFLEKYNYDIKLIISKIEDIILKTKNSQQETLNLLNDDNIWQNFYNFIKKAKTPQKLIGASRYNDLLINLFIPFTIALNNEQPLEKRQDLMQAMLKTPKLQNNIKLNLASNLFFIPPKRSTYTITNAIEQQGLLQLFSDYQNFSGNQQSFWQELGIMLQD